MAKGVHSKRRKKNQSLKRKILYESKYYINTDIYKKKLDDVSKRLFKRTFGKGDDSVITNKKNAFRYPTDPEAVIPQHPDPVFVDRRAKAQPVEFLMRDKKTKQNKKKAHLELLEENYKFAEDKVEGKLREDMVIDINNFDMDMDFDKLNVGENKGKKKNHVMDIDNDKPITRKHKKKKSKSHYIINY